MKLCWVELPQLALGRRQRELTDSASIPDSDETRLGFHRDLGTSAEEDQMLRIAPQCGLASWQWVR